MQPMPDMTALLKIAQSPAGQKLLAMLQSNQSVDMHSIAAAAAAGSLDGAKEKIMQLDCASPSAAVTVEGKKKYHLVIRFRSATGRYTLLREEFT